MNEATTHRAEPSIAKLAMDFTLLVEHYLRADELGLPEIDESELVAALYIVRTAANAAMKEHS